MAPASSFGWQGDNWVFETATLERYSHWLFEKVTDYAMGGAPAVVPTLWKQMGIRTAAAFGTLLDGPEHTSAHQDSLDGVGGDDLWKDISSRHQNLYPG